MKVLSIKQPWASLIAHGIKDIENRSWKTKFRGRIYIHASQKPVPFNGNANGVNFTYPQLKEIFKMNLPERYPDHMSKWPNSAIIGEVDIIDCVVNHSSIWAEKTHQYQLAPEETDEDYPKPIWNWGLANPVLYDTPILNVKGKLSFWEFTKPAKL